MDNLARDAMLAKKAGLSYGKWRALQPVVEVEAPPDNRPRCEYCGNPFTRRNPQQRFCCSLCRERSYADMLRENRLKLKKQKKV